MGDFFWEIYLFAASLLPWLIIFVIFEIALYFIKKYKDSVYRKVIIQFIIFFSSILLLIFFIGNDKATDLRYSRAREYSLFTGMIFLVYVYRYYKEYLESEKKINFPLKITNK
jgi:glucan phosphoethanolaminetransferase (alkaline phosphatase superfamily)